jgi:hypothetical protein
VTPSEYLLANNGKGKSSLRHVDHSCGLLHILSIELALICIALACAPATAGSERAAHFPMIPPPAIGQHISLKTSIRGLNNEMGILETNLGNSQEANLFLILKKKSKKEFKIIKTTPPLQVQREIQASSATNGVK